MNKSFKKSDDSIFTNSEWFVAEITFVCGKATDDTCDNYACSWVQLEFCPNMQTYSRSTDTLYGDCAKEVNIAYPISQQQPVIGQMVLMRFRGTVDQINNVFEFYVPAEPISRLALTAIQCSGGIFSATYSEGCVKQ